MQGPDAWWGRISPASSRLARALGLRPRGEATVFDLLSGDLQEP